MAPATSRSRRAACHRSMMLSRVRIGFPVGPPREGPVPVPASRSALMYMRGTPRRRPLRASGAARKDRYDAGLSSLGRGNGIHCCSRQRSPPGSGSSATRTSITSRRSAIVRAYGTATSIGGVSGQIPRTEMTPRDGVYAHKALLEAGPRPLDHVSSAIANAAKLEVVATADPCDDPEAYGAAKKSELYGLSDRP